MEKHSPHVPVRAGFRSASLPLDPPPFFLEEEILVPSRGRGLYESTVGLLVLIALWLVFPEVSRPLPSLMELFAWAVGGAGFYYGMRLVTYYVVWLATLHTYPSSAGIHPAARGELPRNAFLVVLLFPIVAFVALCLVLSRFAFGFGPTAWIAAAVVAGVSLRDVRLAWNVLFLDTSRWIKKTKRGLDVLQPVGGG